MNNNKENIELEELLAKHRGLIVSQAVSFCRNSDDLEDYISIGTIAFIKAYKNYNPETSQFSTYIVSCIRNAFRKYSKKEEKRYFKRTSMSYIDSEQLWESLPENITEGERIIIELKYEGYSYQEMSDITGYTQKELHKIINKLFKRIRESNAEEENINSK